MNPLHQPVMLQETLKALALQAEGWYFDSTFGAGGHSTAIAQALSPLGRLFLSDRDPEAYPRMQAFVQSHPHLTCHWASDLFSEWSSGLFSRIPEVFEHGLQGILMDLGVCSAQLDQGQRGFSFLHNGPLDMRMTPTRGESAADWLARVSFEDLKSVLWGYGEERQATAIAQALVQRRKHRPFTTTQALADWVTQVKGPGSGRRHPATKTFQALRMVVNQEMEELETGLRQTTQLLAPEGRLVVLTFQGLEVRKLRRFLRSPHAIVLRKGQQLRLKPLFKQAPSRSEVQNNPRSRSAWLWCLQLQ